jgi:hypothetical protein
MHCRESFGIFGWVHPTAQPAPFPFTKPSVLLLTPQFPPSTSPNEAKYETVEPCDPEVRSLPWEPVGPLGVHATVFWSVPPSVGRHGAPGNSWRARGLVERAFFRNLASLFARQAVRALRRPGSAGAMKYIVVTGGMVSGLGKGITISSIGKVSRGTGGEGVASGVMRHTKIELDPVLVEQDRGLGVGLCEERSLWWASNRYDCSWMVPPLYVYI